VQILYSPALESSLWELLALQKHYHPAVSALATSCGTEDDKTPLYDMEDFMAHTYKSLFEQEKKRITGESAVGKGDVGKRKKARISLTFVEPKGLFCEGDVFDSSFKSS
jgi:U3 small nucleolar RNA-associated protein 19